MAVLPGPYRVADLALDCVSRTTDAAHELWRLRGGSPPPSSVHIGHAAEAFRSERHTRVIGETPRPLWAPLSGDYRADDGWVRLHANYPHHAKAVQAVLGDEPSLAGWSAVDVEEAVLAAGGAAAALRTRSDWLAAQGSVVREEPLVTIERLDDAPARGFTPGSTPLEGVRVLDLTHVIAGPVCGRTLAAHGASVLHVTRPGWPVLLDLVRDTDFGKWQCSAEVEALWPLVADTDVFVQSFRPGSLAAKGFGPAELAAARPGIVVVSLSAYGHTGPWRDRRGFDSLVQLATGIAAPDKQDGMAEPRPLPAQALDHGSGWLAAFGVLTALRRRADEGGSWHVRVSLARTAEWLHDLGEQDEPVVEADVTPWLADTESDFGRLSHLTVPGATARLAGPRMPGADPVSWW